MFGCRQTQAQRWPSPGRLEPEGSVAVLACFLQCIYFGRQQLTVRGKQVQGGLSLFLQLLLSSQRVSQHSENCQLCCDNVIACAATEVFTLHERILSFCSKNALSPTQRPKNLANVAFKGIKSSYFTISNLANN